MNQLEDWEFKRFDEFGTLFSGSTPKTGISAYWDGSVTWVTPNDLSRLRSPYLFETAKTLTEKGLKSCSAQLLPSRSIVMSSRAPIGYVAIPETDFCTNQGCKSIKLKKGYDPEFAYYSILHNIDAIKNLGEGTTFAEISKTALASIALPFPRSKPEQTKIAEILSTVDRAIEQTEALIAKQQRIKTGLMQDLLTRGIDEHGNLRSEVTHEFKDSPLGRIPVEWEVENVSSRVLVRGGKRLPAGHAYAEGDTGFRYLRTMDFIGKDLSYGSLSYLYANTFHRLERYEINGGDVFISIAGVNLGVAGVYRPDFDDRAILTENAAKLTLVTDESPEFLAIQLNGPCIQEQILEVKGVGAGVPKLALHRIEDLICLWPKKIEQEAIVQRFYRYETGIREQVRSLNRLHSLKSALMQDLLTGKKRVTALLEGQDAADATL